MSAALFTISYILPNVILLVAIYFLLRPLVRGAVFFPTSRVNTELMMKMAAVKPGDRVVDIGSGDGRLLIAAARVGARAVGYEINPWWVWRSRVAIRNAGVANAAIVKWESFWRADLGEFNVALVYGIPYIMRELKKKLFHELVPGARVVSNIYPFPDWEPEYHEKEKRVYFYIIRNGSRAM